MNHTEDHPPPDPPETADGAVLVDSRGTACPQPVIDLAVAVDGLEVGARVELWSDDASSDVDVPIWCRMRGHALLDVRDEGTHRAFLVERRSH